MSNARPEPIKPAYPRGGVPEEEGPEAETREAHEPEQEEEEEKEATEQTEETECAEDERSGVAAEQRPPADS